MALAGVTDQIVYLEEGDVVDVQLGKHWIVGRQADGRAPVTARGAHRAGAQRRGRARPLPSLHAEGDLRAAQGDRRHAQRGGRPISPELFGDGAYSAFKDVDQVLILACGTSYYSGSVAKYWLESIAGIPTSVEIASEYRYRDSVPNPRTLVVTISQSGETADTLAALEARALARHDHHADDLQRRHQRDGARMQVRLHHARRRRSRRRLDEGLHDPAGRPVPARRCALAQVRGRLSRRAGGRAPQGPAPPAGGGAGGARARAADRGLVSRPSRPRRTRSSSAAACTTRSRSKAR